jgi:putative transcriptional regulator
VCPVTYHRVTVTHETDPTSHPYEEIGSRIRRLRVRTGLSQENFAPLVGVTRRHLVRLEKGQNRPRPTLAGRIEEIVAEKTGRPIPFHVFEDDAPFPESES